MKRRKASPWLGVTSLLLVVFVMSACGTASTPAPAATQAPAVQAPTQQAPTGAPAAATQAPAAQASPTAAPCPQVDVPDPSVTGSLTVLEWAGYDQPDFWVDYKCAYPKAAVNFEIGESDADVYSKMKAGDQADLFHFYSGWQQFYVDENLAQPIDTSKLKNWDKVPDSLKKLGQINGQQYYIPWDWGFSSILYRTDKVPGGIDSWSALLDPKYAGHISMWDDGPSAVTTSSYIHGWDETKVTADQLATIKQEWIAQKKLNVFYWAGEPELQQGIASGQVWVAYAWQGSYATLLGQGVPVAYANPKEGRNSWVGFYGIRKGVADYDLALKFLDEKLGLATGNNVVNEFYYGDSNQDVMKGVTDPTLIKAFSLDDPTILQHTNFTPLVTAAQRDAWTAMWAEVKAAP
jgi:spermidine/putrescine transport system substrate-binding protein